MLDIYGDSRENLLDFSAVIMISSPIFSVCGFGGKHSAANVYVEVRYDVNIYVSMSSYEGGEM